jgi:hypothetical protein
MEINLVMNMAMDMDTATDLDKETDWTGYGHRMDMETDIDMNTKHGYGYQIFVNFYLSHHHTVITNFRRTVPLNGQCHEIFRLWVLSSTNFCATPRCIRRQGVDEHDLQKNNCLCQIHQGDKTPL